MNELPSDLSDVGEAMANIQLNQFSIIFFNHFQGFS